MRTNRMDSSMSYEAILGRCQILLEDVLAFLEDAQDEETQGLYDRVKELIDEIDSFQNRFSPGVAVDPAMHVDFVRFVLGDAERIVLEAVGTHGYGRLADIERFVSSDIPQNPKKAWRRLHSLGLLHGKEYSYLTSRGAGVYQLITGLQPKPAKKDGRLHQTSPPQKCVEELIPKIRHRLPLSNGASLLLKLIGNSKVHDVSRLKNHPVCQHYFSGDDEFQRSLDELCRRNLLHVDQSRMILSTLGRLVWNIAFAEDRNTRKKQSVAPEKRWISDVISYYLSEGYRVHTKSEILDKPYSFFDLWLIRDQRKFGVFFPPADDPDAASPFFHALDLAVRTQNEIHIHAPSWSEIERTKRLVFQWIAKIRGHLRKKIVIRFSTPVSLKQGKTEDVHVEPRKEN